LAASGVGAYLVLGGAGFIGSHVAQALLATGSPVLVADRPETLERFMPWADALVPQDRP
jgi:uncharacterized protein YbjT (DUF2867 family)